MIGVFSPFPIIGSGYNLIGLPGARGPASVTMTGCLFDDCMGGDGGVESCEG